MISDTERLNGIIKLAKKADNQNVLIWARPLKNRRSIDRLLREEKIL